MTLRGRRVDRELIKRVGRPAIWEKGVLCPNIREDGQHPYACPYCGSGRGYLYSDPQTISILFTDDNRKEGFDIAGAWEQGIAEATVQAHHQVGDQDRIINQDDPIRDTIHVTRGSTDTDELRLHYVDEIVLLRDISQTYTLDSDFDLVVSNGNSTIKWLNGGLSPSSGTQYAVMAMIKPVWIVQSHEMIRAFGPGKKNQLPLRLVLKRFDKAVPYAP
jgi:hypothetical protein